MQLAPVLKMALKRVQQVVCRAKVHCAPVAAAIFGLDQRCADVVRPDAVVASEDFDRVQQLVAVLLAPKTSALVLPSKG